MKKIKIQFLTGLFLAGFFITSALAIWPWLVASAIVHCVTLSCSFTEQPQSSDVPYSAPVMTLALEPLTAEEQAAQDQHNVAPDNLVTEWTRITFTNGTKAPEPFIGSSCDELATATEANYDQTSTSYDYVTTIEYIDSLSLNCTFDVLVDGVFAASVYNVYGLVGVSDDCPTGTTYNSTAGNCELPSQPSDGQANMLRSPDGAIEQDKSDPDFLVPTLVCDSSSCYKSYFEPADGSTTEGTITSDSTGTVVENKTSNTSATMPDGSIDSNATITSTEYFDHAGNSVSQVQVVDYSDGTSSTTTNTSSGEVTTGTGTTSIDETGTPDGTGQNPLTDGEAGEGLSSADSLLDSFGSESDFIPLDFPDVLPSYSSCMTINMSWMGHSFVFPDAAQCLKLEKLKEYLGYFFYIMTIWFIFNITLNMPSKI